MAMAAAHAGAVSLRGPQERGIEEVGDQIEHFPPEEVIVNRQRILEEAAATTTEDRGGMISTATVSRGMIQDDFADLDIVGNVVENAETDNGLYYWDEDDVPITKEYSPDPNSSLVSSLTSETKNEISSIIIIFPRPAVAVVVPNEMSHPVILPFSRFPTLTIISSRERTSWAKLMAPTAASPINTIVARAPLPAATTRARSWWR